MSLSQAFLFLLSNVKVPIVLAPRDDIYLEQVPFVGESSGVTTVLVPALSSSGIWKRGRRFGC